MSDDTPTQRLSQDEIGEELVEERKKSRTLMFILIGVGAALLVGIIVLLVILLGGDKGTPTADPTPTTTTTATPTQSESPTPSATPTPTPTPTVAPEPTQAPPPPPPSGPGFTVLAPDTTVNCSMGGPGFEPTVPEIEVRWETRRAAEVWVIMGTDDAANARFMQVPTAGDESDFEYPLSFPCNQDTQKYTLTMVADNGQHFSKTWTVTNNGDNF